MDFADVAGADDDAGTDSVVCPQQPVVCTVLPAITHNASCAKVSRYCSFVGIS